MRRPRIVLAGVALALAAPPALAQGQDGVEIGSGTGAVEGVLGLNMAAGANNQQANAAVIAIGDAATASGTIVQRTTGAPAIDTSAKSAAITGSAFAGSSGLVGVNAVAGSNNQQANLAVFDIGLTGPLVSDATLVQSRGSQAPTTTLQDDKAQRPTTELSPGAFADSSGLVQVSLVGGNDNRTANVFTLTMGVDVKP